VIELTKAISDRFFLLNDGTRYFPSDELVRNLSSAYPGVNVPNQLQQVKLWCEGNPTKRKTLKGAIKFVTGWMAKEQDKSGRYGDRDSGTAAMQMARDRGISPNEFRHLQAGREVMFTKLNKFPLPADVGTYSVNLSRLADKIVKDVYADTERWWSEWSRQSACFGTMEWAIRDWFRTHA
jgi:hypothetical protein